MNIYFWLYHFYPNKLHYSAFIFSSSFQIEKGKKMKFSSDSAPLLNLNQSTVPTNYVPPLKNPFLYSFVPTMLEIASKRGVIYNCRLSEP